MPVPHPKAFPGRTPTKPVAHGHRRAVPAGLRTSIRCCRSPLENPAAFGLSYELEVLLHTPTNSLLGSFGDHKKVERLYQSLKFIAGFAVEINETTLFDDIVLPFPTYLERYDFVTGIGHAHRFPPCGQHDFHWQMRQPVVEPAAGVRHPQEVMQEIADRLGILGDMYRLLNHTYMLEGQQCAEAGPALSGRRCRRPSGALVVRRGSRPGLVPKERRHPSAARRRGSLYRAVPRSARADLSRAFPGSRRGAEKT